MTTVRLSEERLDELERGCEHEIHHWSECDFTDYGDVPVVVIPARDALVLTRGYRRAAALEDMLEDWLADIDPGVCCDLPSGGHRESCLVASTEALLAEGDE